MNKVKKTYKMPDVRDLLIISDDIINGIFVDETIQMDFFIECRRTLEKVIEDRLLAGEDIIPFDLKKNPQIFSFLTIIISHEERLTLIDKTVTFSDNFTEMETRYFEGIDIPLKKILKI